MKKLLILSVLYVVSNIIYSQNDPKSALTELERQYNSARSKIERENDFQTAQGLLQNLNASYMNARGNIINSLNNQYQQELRFIQNDYNNYKNQLHQQFSGYELSSRLQTLENNYSRSLQNLKRKYQF
jgi:hypothetical protein